MKFYTTSGLAAALFALASTAHAQSASSDDITLVAQIDEIITTGQYLYLDKIHAVKTPLKFCAARMPFSLDAAESAALSTVSRKSLT